MRNFTKVIVYFFLISSLVSCGIYKPVDTRKVPISGPERAKKNVAEGRGITLGKAIGMGYVEKKFSLVDSEIYISIRDKKIKAKLVKLPFVSSNV